MAVLQSQVTMRSIVRFSVLFFAVTAPSQAANGQKTSTVPPTFAEIVMAQEMITGKREAPTFRQCSEIAHRIACHAVVGACKNNESSEVFEKRSQLDVMIIELCNNGPANFSKYYWIDIDGAYLPYYMDKDGNTIKYPPDSPK